MRSSTSNSSLQEAWAKVWWRAVILVVACLLLLEWSLRVHGYRPTVTDDFDLWALQRERIDSLDSTSIALLGSSRISIDVSLETVTELLPDYAVVQLGVIGRGDSLATLADIAENTDFKGVVLVSVVEREVLEQQELTEGSASQSPWTHHFDNHWGINRKINRVVKNVLQENLAILHPYDSNPIFQVLSFLGTGEKLPVGFFTFGSDRQVTVDYTMESGRQNAEMRLAELKTTKERDDLLTPEVKAELNSAYITRVLRAEPFVQTIQERGGRVVYVRLPVDNPYADENEWYKTTWTLLRSSTRAKTLHFLDFSNEVPFTTPDGSHLQSTESPRFTKLLVQELKTLGVL
ncbi:MAG: hypothetical protein KDD69_06125 [Bdellovibrionales bacterium]|nr:hypothetical protein [Bdellovibrionales bacterium]